MRNTCSGVLALSLVLSACGQSVSPTSGSPAASPVSATTPALGLSGENAASAESGDTEPGQTEPGQSASAIRLPPAGKVSWDWQIGAATERHIKVAAGTTLIGLDGFTVSAAKVAELKGQGLYTVCYINAGSFEPYRPDSARYPAYLKIQQDPDWPDEAFLDITDIFRPGSVLADILTERMKMCKAKGFDALEPDNLQNDENVSGGRITTQQQIDFNGRIADQAHLLGLAVFQKNGPDKVLLRDRTGRMMVEKFDGILNEACQQYRECGPLAEYTRRGKLALNVEYRRNKALDCGLMAQHGINALKKDRSLAGGTARAYLRETCN